MALNLDCETNKGSMSRTNIGMRFCNVSVPLHVPILVLMTVVTSTRAFLLPRRRTAYFDHTLLCHLATTDKNSLNMEMLQLEQFKRRKNIVERKTLHNELRRPPNPFLGPLDLVSFLLEELRRPTIPSQYSGVNALLETSTDSWRDMLRRSVAAPKSATNAQIAPPLEAALSRPNNQFAILLGVEDENFEISFPTDPLDYGETCWVECRLRSALDDELLVALGWSLEKRLSDGAWVISSLDWQDFRDVYRPGIGREEWERICG